MRLHLIRHGQTASNVMGAIDTSVPGPPLDEKGERQAAALAETLAGVRFDRVVASSQVRAQMTGAALAHQRGIELEVRDGLREVSAGHLEMRTDADAIEQYLTTIAGWGRGNPAAVLSGGETLDVTLGRFDAVVEELVLDRTEHAAIVSHGAMIRVWCAMRVHNVDAEFVFGHPLSNTGIVTVERSHDGTWLADRWESAVLPALQRTSGPAGQPVA